MSSRSNVLATSALAALVLATSFALPPSALPELPLCPMRYFLEVPCPGCGMTHAFLALAHGRFAEAWAHNPFSFLFFAAAIALAMRPLVPRARGPLALVERRRPLVAGAAVSLVAVMWIWDLFRIFA